MAGTRSAPVRYSKGGVRADTRKLDQAQKATSDDLDETKTSLRVETWSWAFPDLEEVDRRFIVNLPYGGTVNSITTVCEAGTATVTGKINTTALGGTANSASTSETTQSHTTANTFAAGDDFRLQFSSISGCEWLTVTVKVTRAL